MSENEELKLKNCPFCGSEPEIYKAEQINAGYFKAVACRNCNFGIYRTTIQKAMDAWNTRKPAEVAMDEKEIQMLMLKMMQENPTISIETLPFLVSKYICQTFAKPSGNERVAPKCGCDGKCLYFSQICEALGWQGGTIHQVLDEIKRLEALSQTQPAHPSPTEDE